MAPISKARGDKHHIMSVVDASRRKRSFGERLSGRGRGWRALALRFLLLLAFGAMLWLAVVWFVHSWAPARDQYASQGVYVDSTNGDIDWQRLAATGVDFAYVSATEGSARRDPAFARNIARAGEAGIRYGAVHHFDLCRLAGDQANQFVTSVPRRSSALPPVIDLDFRRSCPDRPGRAVVLSELGTLLTLIEQHSGKPAVLHMTKEFEELYRISGAINRTVWLDGNFFPPDYAAKPWVMWTANDNRRVGGIDGPVDWLVVRPLN